MALGLLAALGGAVALGVGVLEVRARVRLRRALEALEADGLTAPTLNRAGRASVRLGGEPLSIRARGVFAGGEHEPVRTGDPTFDAACDARGVDGDRLVARLDAETRALARRVVEGLDADVSRGAIRVSRVYLRADVASIVSRLRDVLRLAEALERPLGSTEEALAALVATDPVVEVRLNALERLRARSGDHVVTAARAVRSHDDPRLRLEAASLLGVEGIATLRALVEDEAVARSLRARAVARLARLGERVATPILRQLARAEDQVEAYHEVWSAIIAGLAGHPAPDAEAFLVEIALRELVEAARQACDALARHGSPAAIPALKGLGGVLRRPAERAVAAIEARSSRAETGRLSVAPAGGELALVARGRPASDGHGEAVANRAADEPEGVDLDAARVDAEP